MSSIKYLNTILTVLAFMLAMQLWTSWNSGPEWAAPAHAQGIPDGGAQRQMIVDQLKLLNKRTDEIKSVLTSGKMRVLIAEAPEVEEEKH